MDISNNATGQYAGIQSVSVARHKAIKSNHASNVFLIDSRSPKEKYSIAVCPLQLMALGSFQIAGKEYSPPMN
jgi:hypothetical protein